MLRSGTAVPAPVSANSLHAPFFIQLFDAEVSSSAVPDVFSPGTRRCVQARCAEVSDTVVPARFSAIDPAKFG